MKYLLIAISSFTITFLFTYCGTTSKENTNQNDTVTKVDSVNTKPDSEEQPNALGNMTFAYGLNMQDCDGLTYSEYSVKLKFGQDNTVEQVNSDIVNMGGPEAYEKKETLMGTYTIDQEVVTIQYTKLKLDKIREGKAFESSTKDEKRTAQKLKITKCQDGRLQLISNTAGVTVLGDKAPEGDKSSWSLVKKKQ